MPPEPSRRESLLFGSPAKVAAAAALGIGAGYLIGRALSGRARRPDPDGTGRRDMLGRAQRLLSTGSALLSFSAVADSGIEHTRNRYSDPFMYAAPAVSTVALGTAARQAIRPQPEGNVSRMVYGTAAAVGVVGLGFHTYNIGTRTGGFDLLNFFYGAPLIAPGTLLAAGAAGLTAGRIGQAMRGEIAKPPSGRAVAIGTAGAMLGTVAEAGFLHFRGAFQNPYMVLPVTLPPMAAAALAVAALDPAPGTIAAARTFSGATAVLGLIGTVFHVYGVHRNMGGWGNWSQMITQGPPVPAPPGFTGVALAGLAAMDLLESER